MCEKEKRQIQEAELQQDLWSKVISGLDAARAVAVVLVLSDHFLITDHLFGVHPALGPLGVTIFFVLSGFLITSILLKEYRSTGAISLPNFYRRRAYRIFPTFYVCWLLTAIVELLTHTFEKTNRRAATASFFYFMDYWRAFGPADTHAHMFISWSLAIEEKFYLLWPIGLLVLLRKGRPLAKTASLAIVSLGLYRAVLYLGLGASWKYIYYSFDTRADALLMGCLLSILMVSHAARVTLSLLLARAWLVFVPITALLLTASFKAVNKPLLTMVWSAEPLIVAVALFQSIYWGWKSWTICSSAPVRTVARLSYALYLYHPLAGMIAYWLRMPHVGVSTAILTIVLSVASYILIEKPFLRLRDARSGQQDGRIHQPAPLNTIP